MDFVNVLKLTRIVEYVRANVANDFALPQLAIYLTVCTDEGITMPELEQKLNMPQGSLSRNIKRLSKYQSGNTMEGYDLLTTKPDIHERKRFAVHLTERGKALRIALEGFSRQLDNDT